jgi:hypothetical protein
MTAPLRTAIFAMTGIALLTSTASALNGRFSSMRVPAVSYSYYYVIPYTPYCPSGPIVVPVPDATPPRARPTGEPSASTAEPPIAKKTANDPARPVIVASHALGNNPGAGKAPLAKDRCRVGFWNLSGREVVLTIDGKSLKLTKDRTVSLDLERQFTWQAGNGPQHVERVADTQPSYEVLIRE